MENITKKKATWKLIGNIAFWVVLAFVFFYAVFALFTKQDENSSSFLGISTLSVQSDSMSPTFNSGDLIFVDTKFELADLEVDDVITYKTFVEVNGEEYLIYNSHRITEIEVIDGVYWFTTDGDNPLAVEELVFQSDIFGVWNGRKLTGLGNFTDGFIDFVKSPIGFFLFIVLPCFAFLVYEVIKFVKVVSDYNVQKAVGDQTALKEEAIKIAKAQLEAEQLAKQEAKVEEPKKEEN
ncbi:MAG: signal peptidase I [Tenericutes bacterium HGW-Tenericutes-1]|jgi:signal peptidase I|nr:MAG: signal peptidase I [Tenericutes bacterium HGW-Tenericutes-1]